MAALGLTVTVMTFVRVCPETLAVTVYVEVLLEVVGGVPPMKPVNESTNMPTGREGLML